MHNPTKTESPFDLERFVKAQATSYNLARAELRRGHKTGHWMWYIFPQIAGLGLSEMSQRFAISSRQEAVAYLDHPILGPRLIEVCEIVHGINDRSMSEVFGYPDDLKLKSSLTLFAKVAEDNPIFAATIGKHFGGQYDQRTLDLLHRR